MTLTTSGRRLAAAILIIAGLIAAEPSAAAALPAEGLARSPAGSDVALERKVKAAYLYNFVAYVEWPPSALDPPDAPIVIAVAGSEDAVADVREVIGARTAKGRTVVVRRLREGEPLTGVQIVYVTHAERARLATIARAAESTAALVVSETEGALAQGSMINFRLVDGRVRFDVALPPVERAGLRISSRMLAVAQSVQTTP